MTTYFTENFAFTGRDANRKLQQPVRLPAVSRHIAYRRDESEVDEAKWIDHVEQFIIHIFRKLDAKTRAIGALTSISNLQQDPQSCWPTSNWPLQLNDESSIALLRKRYFIPDSGRISCTGEILPEGSRYETVVISSVWNQLPTLIRFELFEEYFTLTIFLEFFGELATSSENRHSTTISRIITRLNMNPAGNLRIGGTKFREDIEKLDSTLWGEFDDLLNIPEVRSQEIANLSPDSSKDWIMEAFTDFRGFLLQAGKNSEKDTKARLKSVGRRELQQKKFPSRLFPAQFFSSAENRLNFVHRVFPLLLASENKTRSQRFESYEYTWSTFENDTVLYGSCLGKSFDPSNLSGATLTYVLLFENDDRRSVGRVVGRLHTMGSVRLAAMLDFDRILARDQILSTLDSELGRIYSTTNESLVKRILDSFSKLKSMIQAFPEIYAHRGKILEIDTKDITRVREIFGNFLDKMKGFDAHSFDNLTYVSRNFVKRLDDILKCISHFDLEVDAILKKCHTALGTDDFPLPLAANKRAAWKFIKRECRQMQRQYSNVAKQRTLSEFREQNLEHITHALQSMNDRLKFGLEYRNSRAKYHRDLFDSLATAMKIEAIPGFQKYDDFVRHRLHRSYNMIASAEAKHAGILKRATELRSRYHSEEQKAREEKIEGIHRYGEVMLIGVIVPYYIFSAISKFATDKQKFILSLEQILALAIAVSIVAWALTKYAKKAQLFLKRYISSVLSSERMRRRMRRWLNG